MKCECSECEGTGRVRCDNCDGHGEFDAGSAGLYTDQLLEVLSTLNKKADAIIESEEKAKKHRHIPMFKAA